MDEPLEDLYFNWLCVKVMKLDNPTPSLTYWNLFRELHNFEFVWQISGDDNREEDGLDLRSEFLMEAGLEADDGWFHIGCSILELFIAFSRRTEWATEDKAEVWFWVFIENLGLINCNDASNFSEEKVADILNRLVWRTYNYNGRGGLFPLKNPDHDQTKVELWYQFNEYLAELE